MKIRTPENTFTAKLENGELATFLKGTILQEILEYVRPPAQEKIVLGTINGRIAHLGEAIEEDCPVGWIYEGSESAARNYQATVELILLRAALELYPERRLFIDHSLGDGPFCTWKYKQRMTRRQLKKLEKLMNEIIAANEPITPVVMTRNNALEQVRRIGEDPLVCAGNPDQTKFIFYRCGDFIIPMQDPVFTSTGRARTFHIVRWSSGMILHFPRRESRVKRSPPTNQKKLFQVFQEYGHWQRILGVANVADLNAAIQTDRIEELVKISEGFHEKRIVFISDLICDRSNDIRLVLIAGPSSSGKTTFSKRLNIQLRVNGKKPLVLSLDDYFLNRENTPRDSRGNYNFESLAALNIERLNSDLRALLTGKLVTLPHYDFKTGKSSDSQEYRLPQGQPILLEGIHGLNDTLTRRIAPRLKLKIYVSVLTQLNIMDHIPVHTSDVRLLRRLLRDAKYRDYAPADTISKWPSVRSGEEKNIFPYQEGADIIFNSSLIYELAVLRPLLLPFLREINSEDPVRSETIRLKMLLERFLPLDQSLVPSNSLLREFIGQSSFCY